MEHDCSVEGKVMRVSDSVKHQSIGGEDIILEFGLTKEEVLSLAAEGNWANVNFLKRRYDDSLSVQEIVDMVREFDSGLIDADFLEQKLYYGKVNGLGYVVAEDELSEIL